MAEAGACPVEARFHGAGFDVGDGRDFFQSEAFVFKEQNCLALQRRQRLDGVADGFGDGGCGRVGQDCGHVVEIVCGDEALLGAPAAVDEVAGDADQEVAQRASRGVEGLWFADEFEECVLRYVFGDGCRAGHAEGEVVDGVLVVVEGLAEIGICQHSYSIAAGMALGYGRRRDKSRRGTQDCVRHTLGYGVGHICR